jgi:hypothetical protein
MEDFRFLAAIVGGFVVMIVLLAFGMIALQRSSCESQFGDSALPWRFSAIGGCQVRTREGWIPSDNYRVM